MPWYCLIISLAINAAAPALAQGFQRTRPAPETGAAGSASGFTEVNGLQKSFGAALRYGTEGLSIFMPGLEGVYFLNNRWQFTLFIAQGSGPYNKSIDAVTGDKASVSIVSANLKSTYFGSAVRLFLGRNLFLTSGLTQALDTFDVKTKIGSAGGDKVVAVGAADGTAEVTSLLVRGAFGYQWMFGNGLLVTVEWLGVSYPITTSQSFAAAEQAPATSTSTSTGGTSAGSANTGSSYYDASSAAVATVAGKLRITTGLAIGWSI